MANTAARRVRITKSPSERQRDLLDAGLRVLKKRGYERATVAEITAAARVAKGTFYLYFDSKAELVGALRDRIAEQIAARIAERVPRDGRDHWLFFEAWTDEMVAFLIGERETHEALWHGPVTNLAVPERADAIDQIEFAITRGQEAGQFAPGDPLIAASMLFFGIHGAVDAALARDRADVQQLQESARDLARRLLMTNPARGSQRARKRAM